MKPGIFAMSEVHVEAEHVHKVYSQIAEHFSDTRHKPWPRIADFLLQLPPGCLIADVGCGNGKYLGVNPLTYKLGSDICPELVAIARTRGHEVAVCDCLNLPYRSNQFDACICIAVVHHLSTEERRTAALGELVRIVRPGGKILVYVWAMEQERKKFESQDVMVPWHLQPKYGGEEKRPPKTARENEPRKQRKKKSKMREKQPCADCTSVVSTEQPPSGGDGAVASPFLRDLLGISLSGDEEVESGGVPAASAGDMTSKTDGKCTTDITPTVDESFDSVGQTGLADDEVDSCAKRVPGLESASVGSTKPIEGKLAGDGASSKDCGTLAESDSTTSSTARPNLAELGYRTFNRYYHVFQRGELVRLFAQVPCARVREEFYDHENWCVLAEKLSPEYQRKQTIP